jgi:hypothetical protein
MLLLKKLIQKGQKLHLVSIIEDKYSLFNKINIHLIAKSNFEVKVQYEKHISPLRYDTDEV